MKKDATLVLEDGTILKGKAFGASADSIFELVFNTSMTGYQEIITDPSYRGQAVIFTVPHIGNVGANKEDNESATPEVSAIVVRSVSQAYSNWRADQSLSDWLCNHGVPAVSEIDTRYLTRKLRDGGTLKAGLSTQGTDPEELLTRVRNWAGLDNLDMVKEVTCKKPYKWDGDDGDRWVVNQKNRFDFNLVLYDFGVKRNIIRHLAALGAQVTVVPANTSVEDVLSLKPDGIVLSNGPGDPAGLPYIVKIVHELIASDIPIFGICLGHQLIGRAIGGKTTRLKFGHHGGNHPVQDLKSKKVLVTAQNHNYTIDPESLNLDHVEITHISLNDQTVEGIKLKNKPVSSVQFHPEAAPGPHDAHGLFAKFALDLIKYKGV